MLDKLFPWKKNENQTDKKTLLDPYEGPTIMTVNPCEMWGWDDYELTEKDDGTIIIEKVNNND